jgi:MFS family permease
MTAARNAEQDGGLSPHGEVRRHGSAFYGWKIAVTLAVTETLSWGILYYTFSVFLTPMEAELGWTRAELTAGFSLMWLISGVMAFPVGTWIDRHGPRALMTAGSVGASLLVMAWAFVETQTAFYIVWAGLGVCAAAVLYEPAFAVVATWFQRRRAAALAVITFAAGLASTVFMPLADALLGAFGWRTAVFLLGVFLGVMTVPLHALVLRRRPADMGLLPDGAPADPAAPATVRVGASFGQAMHSRAFWLITLMFGLASLSAVGLRVHFIPFLLEGDVSASTAAFATGAIGIMQVVGRVVFAPLEQRFSGRSIAVGVFALQAAAMALLLFGQAPLVVGLFIVLFGAAQGATTLLRPTLLTDLFGTAHYGRISSIMAFALTLTSTAAPLGASLLFDRFGTYTPVVWTVVALAVLATGAAVWAARSARAAQPTQV